MENVSHKKIIEAKFYKKSSEILAERLEDADKQLVKPFV
jgi:hypothetical protein